MPSRTRAAAALGRRHCFAVPIFMLVALPFQASADPPAPHHPGEWTAAQYWPGTSAGVQAVHLMLLRGDTLHTRPHSNLLAWGSWEPTRPQDGGLWGWKPSTDVGADALSNLTKRPLIPPPYNVFCAGHTTIPSATAGDGLLISGLDRNIAGTEQSVRFLHQTGEWGPVATLNARRYYGMGTAIPWGGTGGSAGDDWRILASAGIMYDHMTVFGGRSSAGNNVTSDLQRYQLTFAGGWDQPVTGSGSNWPVAREYHSLAAQGAGPHFLFGGKDANSALRSDFWQLKRNDLSANDAVQTYEWTGTGQQGIPTGPSAPNGPVPSARWRHVAVVDPGSGINSAKSTMYLYGGEDQTGPKDDLWKLWWDGNADPPIWKWSLLSPTGDLPGARVGATAVWDETGNRIVLFGGEGANGALADNEVYVLDSPGGSSPTWRIAQRAIGSGEPAARAQHAMGQDAGNLPHHGSSSGWCHAVVFGGDLQSGTGVTPTNEIWELFVEPGVASIYWQARTPVGSAPAARTGASVIVCERYPQSAIVLGGELAGGGGDAGVWEIPLSSGNWSQKPALAHALRGQTAIRDLDPVTALRPEVYNATTNTWTSWGPLKYQASYCMTFAAAGALWFPGPAIWGQEKTWRLDLDASNPQWSQPAVIGHGLSHPFDQCATGVLYRPNRILKVGEIDNTRYQYPTGPRGALVARYRALPLSAALDVSESSLRWRAPVDTLALSRMFHSLTLLPSGEVIATAGMGLDLDNDQNPENDAPRRRPEIWDPDYSQGETRGYWYGARTPGVLLAEEPHARGHHSAALLLPDGRVVSGGGHDSDPMAQIRSVDIYSPPYLYRAGGTPAFRPRLYGAQDHIGWGGTFEVACPDPIISACLVRPGAVTHTFNQDQLYVPLTLAAAQPSGGGHRVLLNAPASAAVAPPGNYLLFVLAADPISAKLVPSIARWVNVGAAQTTYTTWDTLPPQTVGTLQLLPGMTTTSATLRWTAPTDAGVGSALRAARYELRYVDTTAVPSAMPTLEEFLALGTVVAGMAAPQAAGLVEEITVTGLDPLNEGERRFFRLLCRDNAGSDRNWSGLSNEVYQEQPLGCPFVDTQTAFGWQEENSILGRSLTGALALDGYRLRHVPAPTDGRIHLRVRENEQELTTLDQMRLIAIDHAPGVAAYALGDEVVLGTRAPASRVTTAAGLDLTSLLDGSGEGLLGGPGDTLYVTLSSTAPTGAFGAGAAADPGEIIIDDGGKGGGNPLTWREPDRMSAAAVDAQVLGTTGIRLESRDASGQWQPLAHRYPREHSDKAVFEVPESAPLRLVFVGTHRLRSIGRFVRSGDAFTARKLPLLSATHTRLGDVATAVDTTGNLTTELAAGDTVALEFGWSEIPVGQVRELLLLSRGVYTANLPARGEESGGPPAAFSFHGARPNPFAGGTALRFALPHGVHVRLEVLDAQGRRVALLANDRLEPGEHALTWNGDTTSGTKAGPGVYFYRFEAGEHRARGKLVLTK